MRVPMSTPGSIRSQVTKRDNRVDGAYAHYLAMADEMDKFDRESEARAKVNSTDESDTWDL